MKYLSCVRCEAPFIERFVCTTDYSEFCQKTSALVRRFLSPARAKAVTMLLADFEQGGDIHIDEFIMASSEVSE